MRIDTRKFFFAFFFFILTLVALGYYHYHREQNIINKNIDATLLRAAQSAQITVGDSYHDRILQIAPSEVEDADIIHSLTALAHAQEVMHIYSLVMDPKGNLYFTSSSARERNLKDKTVLTHFYAPYPHDEHIIKAFKNNQTVFDMHEDNPKQPDKFRSIFVPHTTPSGLRYVIAADIETESVQKLSNAAAFKSIAMSLIIFVGALPFLLLYRRMLRDTTQILQEEVTWATDELREVNEILENKVEEKTKELISQSFQDTLTGLPNRHRLQYDMQRNHYRALIILNLHNFKEINDFFGTSAGDDLLRQMGHWLTTIDFIPYRLGGDEFALLIDREYTLQELEEQCNRLIHRLSDHPFSVAEETISLRVTIGVDPGPKVSLTHADIALHQAKDGSSPIAFYDENSLIKEQYKINIAITSAIHQALNLGRIICYYQPIASIGTGRIEKYETLVRMVDAKGQIIAPVHFLKIAQKTRLYPQITKQVIQQACEAFQHRSEEFSINLSIRDILDHNTVHFIEETMVRTNTSHRIIFEILESDGIDNFDAVLTFIRRMKSLGARIAIDDFGTGYSSIENILRLNPDYMKIDGSLIKRITTNPKHAIVVEAIAGLASRLGVQVVAEFVESEVILNHLKTINIGYAQGYLIGKPGPLPID